jgi:RNA polymerase sigma-70 factor (ECF subfamily)
LASSGPSERRAEESLLVRTFLEKRENLLLFLAARTRSMPMAEDLVQELYVKIAGLDPDADVKSPAALLYKMAVNLMIDQVRSGQRAARREAQWRAETRQTIGDEDVVAAAADQAVIAKERVRRLAAAVAELPPQMGRAFRLHKLEGRSQAETARVMGVSQKMVEQHIAAAIRNLAKRLQP